MVVNNNDVDEDRSAMTDRMLLFVSSSMMNSSSGVGILNTLVEVCCE